MVARGDLGVELGTENVPIAQKRIIAAANNAGRVVITATQMLESMIENPRPTRAEASDVANAILDGTDAVMLSGESAVGKFPVETVETMARIALFTEEHGASSIRRRDSRRSDQPRGPQAPGTPITRSLTRVAVSVAEELGCKLILAFTESGITARLLAMHRPRVPVVAVTPSDQVYRQLALSWGVVPVARRPRGQHRRPAHDRRAAAARARHRRERRHDPDAVRALRRRGRDEHAARAHGGMKRPLALAVTVGLLGACSHNPNPKDYKFPPPELAARGTIVEGVASWYGPGFDGKKTASGEKFDQDALTAAHAYWAFGTLVKVTFPSTGRSVVVRINDRFPSHKGRAIDLSKAAAKAIGLIGPGTGVVRLEVIG